MLYQVISCHTVSKKLIYVTIRVQSNALIDTNILNLVNEKTAMSHYSGEFYFLAKAEDLLAFEVVNI